MVTWADSLTVAFVVIFFGRSAFVSLIQERDDVLARNIRRACLAEDAGAGRGTYMKIKCKIM